MPQRWPLHLATVKHLTTGQTISSSRLSINHRRGNQDYIVKISFWILMPYNPQGFIEFLHMALATPVGFTSIRRREMHLHSVRS